MTTEQDIAKSKAEARTAAEKALREAHADEFRALMVQEHEARGLEYKPRLSKEEKAREDILRLAKEHGIRLTFQVETAQDATANSEIGQAAYAIESEHGPEVTIPEGTPVVDFDEEQARRAAQAREVIGGSAY